MMLQTTTIRLDDTDRAAIKVIEQYYGIKGIQSVCTLSIRSLARSITSGQLPAGQAPTGPVSSMNLEPWK